MRFVSERTCPAMQSRPAGWKKEASPCKPVLSLLRSLSIFFASFFCVIFAKQLQVWGSALCAFACLTQRTRPRNFSTVKKSATMTFTNDPCLFQPLRSACVNCCCSSFCASVFLLLWGVDPVHIYHSDTLFSTSRGCLPFDWLRLLFLETNSHVSNSNSNTIFRLQTKIIHQMQRFQFHVSVCLRHRHLACFLALLKHLGWDEVGRYRTLKRGFYVDWALLLMLQFLHHSDQQFGVAFRAGPVLLNVRGVFPVSTVVLQADWKTPNSWSRTPQHDCHDKIWHQTRFCSHILPNFVLTLNKVLRNCHADESFTKSMTARCRK